MTSKLSDIYIYALCVQFSADSPINGSPMSDMEQQFQQAMVSV
jgi:hypothetical protein